LERLAVQPQLVDRVYAAILDGICAGRLAPGARITQDGLAETLAVSRQPVLQALLLLKKQGFVRDTGRRGVIVAPLDPAFVEHVYQVRSALDGTAAHAAAGQHTPDAASRGAALIAAGREAVKARDVGRMIAADIDFHRFVYDLSGNPLIAEAASLHWQHIRRVMGSVLRSDRAARVWDEHAAILAAIVAGHPDEAEKQARAHAGTAAKMLATELANPIPANQDSNRTKQSA
jgi:DNA-binding GntR family transcriptional regulator